MFEWIVTYFSNSNNAQWLEAIGTILAAIFAALGLYIALKSLKKDLNDQQNQINTLVSLTTNIANQTEALKESMTIDSKILMEMTKSLEFNKEIQILRQQKNKMDVKPDVIVDTRGRTIHNNALIYELNIKNIGFKDAKNIIINPELFSNSNIEVYFSQYQKETMQTDKESKHDSIFMKVTRNKYETIDLPELICNVVIDFSDIYGNKYQSKYAIKKYDKHDIIARKVYTNSV